ncbi:hypothetical protein P4O66_007344 [Electrophorus voltai]|uniref:Protein TOPAZ1 n=1 Tax=Electrophorus voltai TaxID=2609070 RepID=A0AAD8ZGI4_9TELE|nr:hypothetical protein P4O66_007344 [Electrophorus voltai]
MEDSVQGCARTSGNYVAWIPDCKSMKLTTGEEPACVPSNPGGVQHRGGPGNGIGGSLGAAAGQEDTAAPMCLMTPLLLQHVSSCCDLNSALCSQGSESLDLAGETREQHACLRNTVENRDSDGEAYPSDTLSCQRTRVYAMCPRASCARTYMSWPFPRHGPHHKMKSSCCVGPHWIEGLVVSDCREVGVGGGVALDCLKLISEVTVEKNNRLAQNRQEQRHFEKLHEMEPDSLEEAQKVLAKCQKNPSKSSESDNRIVEPSERSSSVPVPSAGTEPVHLPQIKPPSPGLVEKHTSKAGENCSLKVTSDQKPFSCLLSVKHHSPVMRSDKANVIFPLNQINTLKMKSDVLRGSSLAKSLKGGAHEVKPTVSHPPAPLQDFCLKPKTSQTPPLLVCPKEERQTSSTMMEYLKMDPQHPSSVMVHSSFNAAHTNGTECNLTPLRPRTIEPNLLLPNSARGRSLTSKDSSSSSGEDDDSSGLSFDPEEVDPNCLLQQDEMCKINKAKKGTSTVCSVVAGGDMDVLRAYAEDAIVLDVIQDDPELFGVIAMGTEGSPNLKPSMEVVERSKTLQPEMTTLARKRHRIVWNSETESPRKAILNGGDIKVENPDGFYAAEARRVAEGSRTRLKLSRCWRPLKAAALSKQTEVDCNNNTDKMDIVGVNVDSMDNHAGSTHLVVDIHSSAHTMAEKDTSVLRPSPTSLPQYCWYYFSDCHSCQWTPCRYLHVPREEDEKFCMEVVQKFCHAKNSSIIRRAVEVVVEYYRTCSPGASFSPDIISSLLSSLLDLGLLNELTSVINTLLTYKRTITETGGGFTVDQWKMMQAHLQGLQVPKQQMDIFSDVQCRAVYTNPQTVELSELAQAMIHVEVYKQQENWAGLASVFCSVCDGCHSAGDLSRFCCCVIMALLKEPKDKLTLPYEPFSESVCHKVQSDGLIKSFLGRVGVSLMCTYHRGQDWTKKGVKLVNVMSRLCVEFSTLKGVLASEDVTSRCQLITVATELFLKSGSIEGALNVLRADEWFVSSSMWPCPHTDVVDRRRVLSQLAERTSHRDTLEVLANLPGLQQPIDGVQVGEYCSVFNTHLQRCVMNQVFPVAADTLEFMLTQGISADTTQLQKLIHKLGKQNMWSRARTLFKRAHSAGYYAEVVCKKASLALPCTLNEIEMTLAFEMFITCFRNGDQSQQPMVITLRRGSGNEPVMESVYLAAGCRLLSAALIPNPKLVIRYTAVNQKREQLFHLDCGSATKWLMHNRTWAQEVWAG